jgi:uncharacterized protein (TIGR00106 family)
VDVSEGNVIAEVSIVPVGTGRAGLSGYIADCVNILQKNGKLRYQVTSMGTIVEGPLKEILETVRLMHEAPFNDGVLRVVTSIRIDDRRDKKITIESKVASVQARMAK